MNNSFASAYFNDTYGYIITSYTKYINGGPDRVMNPVIHLQSLTDWKCIGDGILDALEKTRVAERVSPESLQGFWFWHISGIKSFSAFSKKFCMIDIEKNDKGYELTKIKRDANGSYSYSKDDTVIKLPLDATTEAIGKTVTQILSEKIAIIDDLVITFTTLHDTKVSYDSPSDDFMDIGDGHTDAYQIYTYEKNDKNYIAFLIDNGYSEFTEATIKQRWQQMYGDLMEFDFRSVNNSFEKIQVRGRTDSQIIVSHIYQDGEGMLEILYEVELFNTLEKEKKMIKEEFEKIISSVKIL